ncbi:odorant receptor 85c-like isoform X1 [Frieseomelitta varia]|uniref:odorant receptor 85c-like isoform X1 n=1 Tax=Frieseomelitta varia TaxID=561572 RepID=UPI001CB6A95A|nr:odorant receptor 85c-like isoform X1 [Frieseomelitta varia]
MIFSGFSALAFTLAVVLLLFSPMENGLPIRAQYPFNTTASPSHEIGFTIETCAISGALLGLLGIDSISSVICVLLTQLFHMLNVNFENCTNETNENAAKFYDEHISTNIRYDKRKSNNTFLHRYKTCLRFHQRLIPMCNDYNKLFSMSMFVQMLSSTSIICLTGFQAVVVGGQNSDIIKFGIYLSAGISQLFYICWIGNELSYMSSTLDRSQWLSGWHNECLTNIVQIFTLSTMFTRQSITLKASVFLVLSLETFITVRTRRSTMRRYLRCTTVIHSILVADHKGVLLDFCFIGQYANN